MIYGTNSPFFVVLECTKAFDLTGSHSRISYFSIPKLSHCVFHVKYKLHWPWQDPSYCSCTNTPWKMGPKFLLAALQNLTTFVFCCNLVIAISSMCSQNTTKFNQKANTTNANVNALHQSHLRRGRGEIKSLRPSGNTVTTGHITVSRNFVPSISPVHCRRYVTVLP